MRLEWLPIPGWEDRYEVSNHGQVRSLCHRGKPMKRPRMLSPSLRGGDGKRPCVNLMRNKILKMEQIAVLVLSAFCGPRPEGMECCHNDGNPQNNRLDNLRWDTKKANMADRDRHGRTYRGEAQHLSVFTEDEVRAIRARFTRGEKRARIVDDIVAAKGCDPTVVRDIIGFRTWKHVI